MPNSATLAPAECLSDTKMHLDYGRHPGPARECHQETSPEDQYQAQLHAAAEAQNP